LLATGSVASTARSRNCAWFAEAQASSAPGET
jgi:hypothetical protein